MTNPSVLQSADPKDHYIAAFPEFARNGGRGPKWLTLRREKALERFGTVGFPTTRQEEWRFTSVAPVARTPFSMRSRHECPRVAPDSIKPLRLVEARGSTAVFVNGWFASSLSDLSELPDGVTVGSVADAVVGGNDFLEGHLARYAADEGNPFTALNTAFFQDGALVHVPEGVELDRPIHLLFVSLPGEEPWIWHPRNLIVVERGARAAVIEAYHGLADGIYLTNSVTEFALGHGARGDYVRIQSESERAYHFSTSQSRQDRDSKLVSCSVSFGAQLARHDVNAVLDGESGFLIMDGLSLLTGRQHVDYHTTLDHARPHCESHELFNGIFQDHSRGVFNGRIIVRPGAQRTDSKQTNNNVLLSENARADSQPQLEIYADDVKCTHGSTTGPLDQNALFYLRSRGLSEEQSRAALTYGFTAQVLGQIELAEIRLRLDQLVRERLGPGGS